MQGLGNDPRKLIVLKLRCQADTRTPLRVLDEADELGPLRVFWAHLASSTEAVTEMGSGI